MFALAAMPTWLILTLRAEEAREAANPSSVEEEEEVDHGPGGEGHGGVNADGTPVNPSPELAKRRSKKRSG